MQNRRSSKASPTPAISVVMGSYQCAPYLAQAIDSILGQTFSDFELLISDDCSTDQSYEIIQAYEARDPRVRGFRQSQNIGIVGNHNHLFSRCRADLIAIQDADDWSAPARLENQFGIMQDAHVAVCGTAGMFVYPNGTARSSEGGGSRAINGIQDELPSVPASVLVRSSEVRRVGGWHPYLEGGTSMDRYMLMQVLDGRCGWHIDQPLYFARVRASSNHRAWSPRKMTSHHLFLALEEQRRQTGTDLLAEGDTAGLQRLEDAFERRRDLRAQWLRMSATAHLDSGETAAAANLFSQAVVQQPWSTRNLRTLSYLIRTAWKSL